MLPLMMIPVRKPLNWRTKFDNFVHFLPNPLHPVTLSLTLSPERNTKQQIYSKKFSSDFFFAIYFEQQMFVAIVNVVHFKVRIVWKVLIERS